MLFLNDINKQAPNIFVQGPGVQKNFLFFESHTTYIV